MKKGVIIRNIDQAQKISKYIDAFLIPLKGLSVNYQNTFTIEEIKELKKLKKEIFVFVNKNIENDELKELEKVLKELEKITVQGIIFYDIAIVELKKELNLKTDLVWHQEHLTTNYGTVNYWYGKGAKYAYLSSELTKREIEEIKKNTKAKIFINVFGYIPMFTSKRHILNNYKETFDIKEKGTEIYKEDKKYKINDTKEGTTVYSDYLLNVKEKIDADYMIYNSNMLEDDLTELLKGKNTYKEENGFMHKETIYKVK